MRNRINRAVRHTNQSSNHWILLRHKIFLCSEGGWFVYRKADLLEKINISGYGRIPLLCCVVGNLPTYRVVKKKYINSMLRLKFYVCVSPPPCTALLPLRLN